MANETLVEIFTGIADAIRAKEGTTDSIPVSDMATRISAIETEADIETEQIEYDSITFTQVTTTKVTFGIPVTYNINKLCGVTLNLVCANSSGSTGNVIGGIFNPITIGDNYSATTQVCKCAITIGSGGSSSGECTFSGNTITITVYASSSICPASLTAGEVNVTYIPE